MSFIKTSLVLTLVATATLTFAQANNQQDQGTMRVYDNGHLVVNKHFNGQPMTFNLPSHHAGKGPKNERIVIKDHGPHQQSSEVISFSDNSNASPQQMQAMLGPMQKREAQMDQRMMRNMRHMDRQMQRDVNQAFADFPPPMVQTMPPRNAPPAPILHHAAMEAHNPVVPPEKGKRSFLQWLRDQFSS
jgi:hypothetical protein